MKRRSSLYKAQWTLSKEEEYRKSCDELLYGTHFKLDIRGNKVYMKSEDEESFLLEIDKSKAMWFQIWLKLKSEK